MPGSGRTTGQLGQKSESVSTYTRGFEGRPERELRLTLDHAPREHLLDSAEAGAPGEEP